MKKNKFLKILKAPENINEKEFHSLVDFVKNYPYCQVLHILIAKGSRILSHVDAEKKLHHAAVYATDRKNLKQLMEGTYTSFSDETISEDNASSDLVKEKPASYKSDTLKVEIESYLEKLRSEKLNLQFQSETGVSQDIIIEREQYIHDLDAKITEAEAKLVKLGLIDDPDDVFDTPDTDADLQEKDSKVNEDLYKELQENLNSLNSYKQSEKEDPAETSVEEPTNEQKIEPKEYKNIEINSDAVKTFSNNIEKERMEEYLASLKASPEEQNIANEKLKEQIKIINQFIENEPKLSRLEREDSRTEKRVDLSLKSLKVHQNMASENLALIMVKQGKVEKAEKIYNKLILKFPEKKAYFVAQIEDLKKK